MANVQSGSSTPFVSHTQRMLATHPHRSTIDGSALLECVQACFDCAQACQACADACLGEGDPKAQVRCIRLNLDCADVCEAAGKILSRQTAFDPSLAKAILTACTIACGNCAEECEKHAQHMEHCRVCAHACRLCQQSCERLAEKTASA